MFLKYHNIEMEIVTSERRAVQTGANSLVKDQEHASLWVPVKGVLPEDRVPPDPGHRCWKIFISPTGRDQDPGLMARTTEHRGAGLCATADAWQLVPSRCPLSLGLVSSRVSTKHILPTAGGAHALSKTLSTLFFK